MALDAGDTDTAIAALARRLEFVETHDAFKAELAFWRSRLADARARR